MYTNVNLAFNANAASGPVTSPATNLVMSYNNYYFNYCLPSMSCTLTQAVSFGVPDITILIPFLSFSNRAFYSQKCHLMCNTFKEQILTWALPLPLFRSNEWITPRNFVNNYKFYIRKFSPSVADDVINRHLNVLFL